MGDCEALHDEATVEVLPRMKGGVLGMVRHHYSIISAMPNSPFTHNLPNPRVAGRRS